MLSSCLIVKNELNNLKQLLPQLKIFSDEIIIVDTGSNDGTVEFLKSQKNIKLFHKNWNNDFSEARNFSISKASSKFIIWLDADDRLDKPEILKKIKFNFIENEIYALKLINSSDDTYSYQIRIFPNLNNIKFQGKIHEQLIFPRVKFKIKYLENIKIIHTGYENKETLKKKQLRNIEILNKIKDKTFYEYLQLAESYKILGNFDKSYYYFKKALNFTDIINENPELFCFIFVEIYKISEMLGLKNSDEILKKVEKYGIYFPLIFYYLGRISFKKKEFTNAEKLFENFLKLHSLHRYLNPVPLKIDLSAIYFLAKVKIALKKFSEAKNLINELLKLDKLNKSYIRLYEELKEASNDASL